MIKTKTLSTNNTSKKYKTTPGRVIAFIILLLYAMFLMIPFAVIIITSFTTYEQIFSSLSFTWWPRPFSLKAYIQLFTEDPLAYNTGISSLLIGFLNTMWMTLLTVTTSLFVSGLTAYAYSKFKFKGKDVLFSLQLATLMIPGACLTLPSYIFYDTIGWSNSVLPIIIPGLFGSAIAIFFLRSYFNNISNDLIDAAKIDGLGHYRIYTKVIIPIAMPAFVAQFIFMFVGSYNNYLGPLLYLYHDETQYTLQLALSELHTIFGDPNQLAAGAVIALIPLVIFYIAFQRFFIEGISVGSIKG